MNRPSAAPPNSAVTRRAWAAALVSMTAAPVPAAAQETPVQLLEQARQSVRRNRELLAAIKLPMAIEPAFQFKA